MRSDRIQELARQRANVADGIGVVVKAPDQNVVFGLNVGVASIFLEHELSKKNGIVGARFFPEQRAPQSGEGLALDLTQYAEQFPRGLAQNILLRDLKCRDRLSVLEGFLLADSFVPLQRRAATFQHSRKLAAQFSAQKLEKCGAPQNVNGQVTAGLGLVENRFL